jgi:saccharopine dehydrogenase-like NADP-dependent oxidoreductase
MNHHIVVAGAGGIGRAVALLLASYPGLQGRIVIGDRSIDHAMNAASWVNEGKTHPIEVSGFELPAEGLDGFDHVGVAGGVLLDCLPGNQAPRMARFALRHEMHYANLTEYVAETEEIIRMASDASTGFVLQTGLAPGFINLLARNIYEQFVSIHGIQEVDYIGMRVGALTLHTQEPHYYGFTWSPVGVATEYSKQSLIIRNGKKIWKEALSERETMIIDGQTYEADLTSGGAADLPDAFLGITKNLDYKTLRYPGHYAWVESIRKITEKEEDPIQALENAMLEAVPAVEDDLIVIYASVSGRDEYGILRRMEKSFHIEPIEVGGKRLRAIQSTTAAPLAECARLLLKGKWKGIIQQSDIDTESFLSGPFVNKVYVPKAIQEDIAVVV